ncbi:arginine--tRNA ligase [Polycyclovorans algicola]|uniref:arginine--tRNA ligase n=1 Tax=Polycyclovorans algicola TaxID=616992 RepID=UPI0004A6BA6C|nr:arginine--tRNA ligase [Polycyclovorans algicola]
MKAHLGNLLESALVSVTAGRSLEVVPTPQVEATKDPRFGDFQTNLALMLAKPMGLPPRKVAEALVSALPTSERVTKVDIAGPGFINFHLAPGAFQAVVAEILAADGRYGRDDSGARGRIMVEFVSANPTGPMHVGHGRNAAYGDTVANLLAAAGWSVWREYYINDAGRQTDVLTVSVWLRYLQRCGVALAFPQRAYPADYIRVTADRLFDEVGAEAFRVAGIDGLPVEESVTEGADDAEKNRVKLAQEAHVDRWITLGRQGLGADYERIKQAALADQLATIRATLESFSVRFDQWTSEADLVARGAVQIALARLAEQGLTYEKDGALWMRSESFGDEKDRVLIKADGAATYYCNDLAYHVDKLDRDWPRLLDVWGADHHGYILRVRAAIEALTGRKDALDVQLIQFVTLSSGRMGKRSGNFVTLQDLIDEAGADATRFFYLMRGHEQHLEFDVDLAKSRSTDNPVYYVQYAHARLCSVFAQAAESGAGYDRAIGLQHLARLDNEHEKRLLTALARFPEVIASAAQDLAPHRMAFYLKDELADAFHSYYNAHKFLIDDAGLQAARLTLCDATRAVLASGLALLGVSAPERM